MKYLKHVIFQIHHLWRLPIQRDIIQKGAIWRTGSGEKINIWQQRWLPRKHPPMQPNCPLESFENHIVDTLIDPVTRRWNEELVDG